MLRHRIFSKVSYYSDVWGLKPEFESQLVILISTRSTSAALKTERRSTIPLNWHTWYRMLCLNYTLFSAMEAEFHYSRKAESEDKLESWFEITGRRRERAGDCMTFHVPLHVTAVQLSWSTRLTCTNSGKFRIYGTFTHNPSSTSSRTPDRGGSKRTLIVLHPLGES